MMFYALSPSCLAGCLHRRKSFVGDPLVASVWEFSSGLSPRLLGTLMTAALNVVSKTFGAKEMQSSCRIATTGTAARST
jgi:hypothetical protein